MSRLRSLTQSLKTFQAGRPSDASLRDFRRFGGIPNDPTAAANNNAAILLAATTFQGGSQTIYFPAGTWYFNDSIKWSVNGTSWFYGWVFEGEGQANTTIRLIDSATGFTDAANPKSFIITGGPAGSGSQTDGSGNQAFANYIMNLTIDTGNNAGARALDYFSNNRGAVRNVTIQCTNGNGYSGVEESRVANGPCTYANVSVIGFQYGFNINNDQFSQTYLNCTLFGQTVAGMLINQSTVAIENLTSTNSVPALLIGGARSHVCLVNASLSGGSTANSAIVNTVGGSLYLRNVTTSGYQANQTVSLPNGQFLTPATITEHASQIVHNFQSPPTALKLPINQAPTTFTSTNLSDWANVQAYGAIASSAGTETLDALSAFNAAAASNKPIVYLPKAGYSLINTWSIPASVKRLAGSFSSITGTGTAWNASSAKPIVQTSDVGGTTTDPLVIEYMFIGAGGLGYVASAGPTANDTNINVVALYHNSTRPLVIRSCRFDGDVGIKIAPNAGPVYIEEVQCNGIRIGANTNVWIRGLNIEYKPMIKNDGGTLWILGFKSEGAWVNVETKNGGSTELLGAYMYPIESFKAIVTFTAGSANIAGGRNVGNPVVFSTTGTLPPEFTAGTTYYVKTAVGSTNTLSATLNGAAIIPSTTGTGTHTLYYATFADYLNQPAIVNTDSNFAGVITVDGISGQVFNNLVSETRSGLTKYLKTQTLIAHGSGGNCPLYTNATPLDSNTEQVAIDLKAIGDNLGGQLSTSDAAALSQYLAGLRTDNLLNKVAVIFPAMGQSLRTALYMIDNRDALTDSTALAKLGVLTGSSLIVPSSYSRKTGIQSSGSGCYIDANLNLSSFLTTTDIGLHFWSGQNEAAGNTHLSMGCVNSALTSYTAIGRPFFNAETGCIGGAVETASNCPTGIGNSIGMCSVVNNGDRTTVSYFNGVPTGTAASAPPSGTFSSGWRLLDVIKAGSTTTPQKPTQRNMLFAAITKGLTAAEVALFYQRTLTFMQALQRTPITYTSYSTPTLSTSANRPGTATITASPYTNDITLQLKSAAISNGAPMTTSDLTAFDNYITALTSNSLIAKVLALFPWLGENVATAMNYVRNTTGTPTLTNISSANYSLDGTGWSKLGGIKGNGSSNYVSLLNPSSVLSQTNGGLHCWSTQTESGTGARYMIGGVNSTLTNYTALGTTGTSSRVGGVIGGNFLGSDAAIYTPDGAGMWSSIANSSKQSQLYLNGSAVGSLSSAATGSSTLNGGTSGVEVGLYALGLYKRGTSGVQSPSNRNQVLTMLTSTLTSTEVATLYSLTHTFLQALGRVA